VKFLIVGTVSNCSLKLHRDLSRIHSALKPIGSTETFLVESDSTDLTVEKLNELSLNNQFFNFISMGNLKPDIPERIERIRFCRNRYVEYIRSNIAEREWDYVVVADLDGMNSAVSVKGVRKSLDLLKIHDSVFSNQTFGYYDLLALRCPNWVTGNFKKEIYEREELQSDSTEKFTLIERIKIFLTKDKIRREFIYKRMRVIPKSRAPIMVESAFGGFGIYKSEIFKFFNYDPVNSDEIGECEHLALHARCRENGYSLVVNPALINNHVNSYNLNKLFLVRLLRHLKKKTSKK